MKTIKIIDLINLYRLNDITRIEIRRNNWFVLEAEKENIPNYIKNKEVFDFVFYNDKLVVNYAEEEEKLKEEDEFEDIEEITLEGQVIGYGVLSKWLGSRQTDKEKKLCSAIECLGTGLNVLIKNQKKIISLIKKGE